MSVFQKPQNMQKMRFNFESYSVDNQHIVGLKSIKSFFSSLGLYNDLFLNDLMYYFPQLSLADKQQEFKISFHDCLALIDFLICKKDRAKNSQNKIQSFRLFDKGGNGLVNAGDLLPVMKKHLSAKQYQLYSQIISTSFGPTINYLEVFKSSDRKNV